MRVCESGSGNSEALRSDMSMLASASARSSGEMVQRRQSYVIYDESVSEWREQVLSFAQNTVQRGRACWGFQGYSRGEGIFQHNFHAFQWCAIKYRGWYLEYPTVPLQGQPKGPIRYGRLDVGQQCTVSRHRSATTVIKGCSSSSGKIGEDKSEVPAATLSSAPLTPSQLRKMMRVLSLA
ncbi:hypothetical protein EAF00_012063 [Botryotinia globosa]|nr:hypothetical protein EAF00_012063 [Botryotinia globosa]